MAINNLQIMNTGRSELWICRGDLPHCVRHIPSRSPRGPLQSCGKSRSCAAGAAIPFMPNALQKQAFDGLGHKRNQHRVAMLTP